MAKQAKKQAAGRTENAKRGETGPAIVAEVNRLVASEGITKNEAFKRIAESTGRSPGTVSVTYYRITGKEKRAGAGAAVAQGGSVRSLKRALDDLGKFLLAQQRELEELRKESAKFRAIRRLLS